jgi:hypothetical protein
MAFRRNSEQHEYTCPCCGFKTLDEPPGTYDICPICFWEDDQVQSDDPDYSGGANRLSLSEAQKNYARFGAFEKGALDIVRRPTERDRRDPNWRML